MNSPMTRTSYYVDGFNLYHAIRPLARPELEWLNLHALATSYLRKDDELAEVRTSPQCSCGMLRSAAATEPI
jgi:hypothetical protein